MILKVKKNTTNMLNICLRDNRKIIMKTNIYTIKMEKFRQGENLILNFMETTKKNKNMLNFYSQMKVCRVD